MTVYDLAKALPDIATLRDRCRVIAMLDAVLWLDPADGLSDDITTFEPRWRPGEELVAWSSGGGDDYSIVFCDAGVFIRGFDHESPMSPWRTEPRSLWPGLVDGLPDAFHRYVTDPVFSTDGVLEATVCLWRPAGDARWHSGNVTLPPVTGGEPDGASMFDGLVEYSPHFYHEEAEDLHERDISVQAIEHVYALRPLTDDVVRALNPDLSLRDVREHVERIGYPA